jgi:hypothetical protein
VVSLPGLLAGSPNERKAKQLVLLELVAVIDLTCFRARLLVNGFLMWVLG